MNWLAYIGCGLLGIWAACHVIDVILYRRDQRRDIERRLREWVG